MNSPFFPVSMPIVAFAALAACSIAPGATPLGAQNAGPRVEAAALRKHLFTIAADSMGGRDTGSRGAFQTADYVAAQFKAAGLEPAGENGTYFQTVPFLHTYLDPASTFRAGARTLRPGFEYMPVVLADGSLENAPVVYGGIANDTSTWITSDQAAGAFVVFGTMPDVTARTANTVLNFAVRNERFDRAAGFALTSLDRMPVDMRGQRLQGRFATITPRTAGANAPSPAPPPASAPQRPTLLITARAASLLFHADVALIKSGASGGAITGTLHVRRDSLPYAARNVVAVLRGTDPVARNTYMALTAHNDHVGLVYTGADHDSVYAYNRVVRPMGADSPDRTPTGDEWEHINAIRDSLRRIKPSVRDSIYNGADDDGSGTVALIEVARALAAGPRTARSILFVNHTAEERGLVGSSWFTTYPTVPRDSIVGEMDMDMVGRGNLSDLPAGGPGYLEVVGAKRLSREYGDLLEQVNSRQPVPFSFNYEFDAPGHPLQYYCRADHYNYARWSIPAFAVSRGEHADYHQVTDEAQYIDYNNLARVANLAMDFARTIASMDHRPLLDKPKADPNTTCRQ